MAYLPGHAPTSLGYTPPPKKKKPKPPTKPTGSFDPSNSLGGFTPAQLAAMTPDQLAQVQFGLSMAGPPTPDFEALQGAALRSAQSSAQPQIDYINQERARQDQRQKLSSDAATNFSSAFAQILQGGKTGAEGEQYALDNFGGSYLGGIAARMGQQLISQQQDYFNEQDFKLAGQLADIMDAIPGEADKVYQDLVSQTQDILTAPYKNQIAAIAALISEKRKSDGNGSGSDHPYTKNFSDGTTRQWNPKTRKWDVVTTKTAAGEVATVTQGGGAVVGYDPVTGKVKWTIPGTGKTGSAKGSVVTSPSGDGNTVIFSSASGAASYGRSQQGQTGTRWVVKPVKGGGYTAIDTHKASPGSSTDGVGTTSSGAKVYPPGSAYSVLNGLSKARQASEIYKWKKLARDTAAGSVKLQKTYQESIAALTQAGIPLDIAQNALNRYWKRGETKPWEQPGEGRPTKSWQERNPGKAKAARVAASSTLPPPQAIDFNWLASATTGKTGWTDLGGPSAHYSKHDSGENWESNNAWDIGMPIGTPIYATTDGVIGPNLGVQASRPNDGARLTLSGAGNAFWYGHLSRIVVQPGQRVQAGQLIGYSGASANGAAHLHIGVMNIGEGRA